MTQNGVPRATLELNADGDAASFAVQALSRFVVPQALIAAGALAPGAVVLSVANVGQTLAGLSVDDLSLKEMVPACRTNLGAFLAQSARDSCVLDAFISEQIAKYPQYKWFHVFPGLVASERFNYNAFPWPANWLVQVFMHTPWARTPQDIANLVTYVRGVRGGLTPDRARAGERRAGRGSLCRACHEQNGAGRVGVRCAEQGGAVGQARGYVRGVRRGLGCTLFSPSAAFV